MLAIDTETVPFSDECPAPPIVCVSFSGSSWGNCLYHANEGGLDAFAYALSTEPCIVGHNFAYDTRGLIAARPSLAPMLFEAYRSGRIIDTQVMATLHDIEKHGDLDGWRTNFDGSRAPARYNLASLCKRFCGLEMQGKDTTRLGYGELLNVPLVEWPDEYKRYATVDAINTRKLAEVLLATGVQSLADTVPQTFAALCFSLMSAWGLTTHGPGVAALRTAVENEMAECTKVLLPAGLMSYRRGTTREIRQGAKAIRDWYTGKGPQPDWQGHEDNVRAYTPEDAHAAELKRETKLAGIRYKMLGGTMKTKAGAPSTKGEHLKAVNDPILDAFAASGALSTQLSTQLPALERGVAAPIHSWFKVLQVTGRSSSSDPNVQNQSKREGFREAFIPRPGNVYYQADYSSFELFALAEVCTVLLGHSALGEALNAGRDPHSMVGSQALGITYDEFVRRLKGSDKALRKACNTARQMGKIANFGLAGGLVPKSLVLYAKEVYGMTISLDQAIMIERMWHRAWPEMRPYFAWVKARTGRQTGPIPQLYTGRIRGNCRFTQGANTPFQGLAADAIKRAMCHIFEACYAIPSSPLFGSRIVNMIHDELIGEAREARAAECAKECSRIMVVRAQELMPHMKLRAEPCLMRYWSKSAETLRDENGRLVPWPLVA